MNWAKEKTIAWPCGQGFIFHAVWEEMCAISIILNRPTESAFKAVAWRDRMADNCDFGTTAYPLYLLPVSSLVDYLLLNVRALSTYVLASGYCFVFSCSQ